MKKIILSAIILASTLLANAQETTPVNAAIKAGTISAGGSIGIQLGSGNTKTNNIGSPTTTTDAPNTFGFNILPNVQYFVADNFSVGLQIGIGGNSSASKGTFGTTTTETTTNSTQFQISPYVRYYLMLPGGNVGFFGQGAVGITTRGGTQKTVATSGGTSSTVSTNAPNQLTFGVGFSPGIVFFPSSKIGIEAVIGNIFALQSTTTTTKIGTTGESVQSGLTLDILNANTLAMSLGFNYYFGR